MTILYTPEHTEAHITSTNPMSKENAVVCVSVTTASPHKPIKTPIQQTGLTISFSSTRVRINVKIGDEAIIKLLTPAGTLTEPVLNRNEYRKTPDKPLVANNGRSFSLGRLILLITPTIPKVKDATPNRITITETGLYPFCKTYLVAGNAEAHKKVASIAAA